MNSEGIRVGCGKEPGTSSGYQDRDTESSRVSDPADSSACTRGAV